MVDKLDRVELKDGTGYGRKPFVEIWKIVGKVGGGRERMAISLAEIPRLMRLLREATIVTKIDPKKSIIDQLRNLAAYMHQKEREQIAVRYGITVDQLNTEHEDPFANILEMCADHIDKLTEELAEARRRLAELGHQQ